MSQLTNVSFALATIVAILMGPVLAVLVTRWVDIRRAKRDRQWDIFRTLMRHRRTAMNVDFVGALNLVEVEFAKSAEVVAAWRELLGKFELLANAGPEQLQQLDVERSQSQARLLNAIAKKLGIEVEQLDIFFGGYSPRAWFELENEQAQIRQWLAGVASGHQAFPVVVYPPPQPAGNLG